MKSMETGAKGRNTNPLLVLGIRPSVVLTRRQKSVLSRIIAYDMSFVLWKLIEDKKIQPRLSLQAEREFKRFVALVALGSKPMAMIGPLIDEVWHQFILFTDEYRNFCEKTVGRFINHLPDTPFTPIPETAGTNFLNAYRNHFGALEAIWFSGMNKQTINFYRHPNPVGKPAQRWSGWTGAGNGSHLKKRSRTSASAKSKTNGFIG
jgi:hypothetical protein